MIFAPKRWLVGVGIVVVLGISVFWWLFSYSILYDRTVDCRLTLTFDTPEGERSGTGVVSIQLVFRDALTRALGFLGGAITSGQAVVVDLGPPGPLFVLLAKVDKRTGYHDHDGNPYQRLVESLFPEKQFHGAWPANRPARESADVARERADYFDELNRVKPEAEVPLADLPTVVRFRDLADPASVERVELDDLAATLGANATFKRATFTITSDARTMGLARLLPWVTSFRGGLKPIQSFEHLTPDTYTIDDLIQEPRN